MPETKRYPLEGCSELEVKYFDWHCSAAKGCGAGDHFMQIRNVGCGVKEPTTLSYQKGERPYKDEYIDGKVLIEAESMGRQIDVLRVRFTYTLVQPDGKAGEAARASGERATEGPN
jgi:hypothetical protein